MIKRIVLGAIFALGTTAVVAQDAYVGVSLDYGRPHAGDTYAATGLLGGLRFGDSDLSYGAEVDVDLASGGPYDASRLRGTIYNDMGKLGLFAAVGATYYDLDAGGSETGINYGLGADFELYGNMTLRAEAIRDHMPDYTTDVTTLRIGVTFGF